MIFWIAVLLFKAFFHLFYRFQVYGTDSIYPGAAILAPNHHSFLDPPLICAAWPQHTYYLARASLFRFPFFAWLLRAMHAYPVSGSAQDLSSFKMIQKLLEEGKKVVIFPEGVRSEDGQLAPIKTGVAMIALRAQCPIIPVYIHGTFEAWSRHRRWPKFGIPLACVFGDPIDTTSYAHLDKKQAREALTQELQNALIALQTTFNKKK